MRRVFMTLQTEKERTNCYEKSLQDTSKRKKSERIVMRRVFKTLQTEKKRTNCYERGLQDNSN
jgi:uncharacterized protein YqhQ